jgi:dipeptidyl aminopeptidase/acylaminoacyl peptidase
MLNYAGSTGYGLDYQRRLDGFWGIADSADACSAAAYLINESIVDGSRVGLVGPSAGGYLTLKAVCDEPALWAAGISLFGISDTRAFAATTHKFESHYTNLLIFAHHEEVIKSEEEMARIHVERSPLHHVNRIKAPLLLLQGTEDWVVRPQQATDMHDALQRQGRTSESVFFSGEGHSYWKGEAWRRSLIAQEQWWKKYLLRLE